MNTLGRFAGMAAFGCLLLTPLPALAQAPATSHRGQLSGYVASDDGAVGGVLVELMGPRSRSAVVTDARGYYEFSGLERGTYSISCRKTGFVTDPPGRTALLDVVFRTLQLDEEKIETLNIRMTRAAALTVKVTDELGQPRADVWVQALTVTEAPAGRTQARASIAAAAYPQIGQKTFYTDDRGEIRIYGIPAGAYVIVASPRASPVFDGAWRERYAIYPPTYYPSTPRLSDAQIVPLRAGDDVQLGLLSLVTMPAPTIRGRVVRDDGSPARGAVVLSFDEASPLTMERLITPDYLRAELVNGRFEFQNVPPGDYVILYR